MPEMGNEASNIVIIDRDNIIINGCPLQSVYSYKIEVDADNLPVGVMSVTFGFDVTAFERKKTDGTNLREDSALSALCVR